jgi:hypothetical protein
MRPGDHKFELECFDTQALTEDRKQALGQYLRNLANGENVFFKTCILCDHEWDIQKSVEGDEIVYRGKAPPVVLIGTSTTDKFDFALGGICRACAAEPGMKGRAFAEAQLVTAELEATLGGG